MGDGVNHPRLGYGRRGGMSHADDNAESQARSALIGRLVAGHFACYPMMVAASIATMSLSIIAQREALLRAELQRQPSTDFQRWVIEQVDLDVVEAVRFELIMSPIVWVLLLIFVATHIATVPWALAARAAVIDPPRGERRLARATRHFFIAGAGTTGLAVAAGVVGWVIIFTS